MAITESQRDAANAAVARMSPEHRDQMQQLVKERPSTPEQLDPAIQTMIDQAVQAALAKQG